MKRTKIKKCLTLGTLYLGISVFLWNCQTEEEILPVEIAEASYETTSFEKAVALFEAHQQRVIENTSLTGRNSEDQLQISPDWETFDQETLTFTDALLSNVKADIDVNLDIDFDVRLVFLKTRNVTFRTIESVDAKELYEDGSLKNGKVFYHRFNGNYLDGFIVENGTPTKRLVYKSEVNQASFLSFVSSFFQESCEEKYGEFSNNCIQKLDEVVVGSYQETTTIELAVETNWPSFEEDPEGEETSGGGGKGGGDPNEICARSGLVFNSQTNLCEAPDDDLGRRKECKKIAKALDSIAKKSFIDKLASLSSAANLNSNKEKSIATFEFQTMIDEREGTANEPTVAIDTSPINRYTSLAHTHPNIGSGTLSVFSPGDLIAMANLINKDKLGDDFVAFLTTKKGTQYAITINNKSKFLDFFYSQLYRNVSDVTAANRDRFFTSKDAFEPIYDKYFNPDLNPKIKETDTNNENVLDEFLRFMDEADVGATLFESNNDFTTFTKVALKNNKTDRKTPCN